MQNIRDRVVEWLVVLSLGLFPLSFVFPIDGKALPYVLALAASVYLLIAQAQSRQVYAAIRPVALPVALALPYALISIALSQGSLSAADNALHFLYFVIIAVCFLKLRNAHVFWLGLSAAAFGAGALAIYQRVGLGIDRPYGLYGINEMGMSGAIKFGMVSALFSLLALLAALDRKLAHGVRLCHAVAAITGFAGCLAIASRGPLAAMALVGLFILASRTVHLERQWHRWALFAGLCGILVAAAFLLGSIQQRITETLTEFTTMSGGNLNTSIGTRLEMWKAAWTMFATHPIFGVGINQFGDYLHGMIKAHQAPDFIALYGHAHNEYLEALATGGLVGFGWLIWLFAGPLVFFARQIRRLRAVDADTLAPTAGMVTMLCFIVFAFGDNILDRQMTNSLLAFLAIGFAVLSVRADAGVTGQRL